jgi:hypothetical protein
MTRLAETGSPRRHLRLVGDVPVAARKVHAVSAPILATMQSGAEPEASVFSALHFMPCVVCGRELVRIVHGFATELAAGLFIVEQGWLDFAVYETRRLPEVLRE